MKPDLTKRKGLGKAVQLLELHHLPSGMQTINILQGIEANHSRAASLSVLFLRLKYVIKAIHVYFFFRRLGLGTFCWIQLFS